MSVGFLLPGDPGEYQAVLEEFPAYSSVLLRLALVNLRTVIVTAAVYRGFNQELAPHHLTFRHRAGVTPYTSTFVFAECCVFVKQSQPPFHCDPYRLPLYAFTYQGRTLSRSYGANLPSSFTRVLSSALEYSSCPPVSVCGTVDLALKLRGFSWKQGIGNFRRASPPSSSRLS